MDVYHIWCDLKPGVRDLEFADALQAFLGRMSEAGHIAGYRLTRRKLGLALGAVPVLLESFCRFRRLPRDD